MRIGKWNIKEALVQERDRIITNGEQFMRNVMDRAIANCPIGHITREGKFVTAGVEFTRKRGKGNQGKGSIAKFQAERWYGREPGSLAGTIRMKTIGGIIRVYAGNYKIYYSFLVERGTVNSKKRPFLRPAFFAAQNHVKKVLEGRA